MANHPLTFTMPDGQIFTVVEPKGERVTDESKTMSDTIGDLAASLAVAQGEIKGALKDSDNPFFKSKYADLASTWDACRAALSHNELAVVQIPGMYHDGLVTMTTILMHCSGEWVKGTLTIPLAKPDAQGYGSAISYARRYALAAMVGVAPEDDDGNAASQRPAQQQQQKVAPPPPTKPKAPAMEKVRGELPKPAPATYEAEVNEKIYKTAGVTGPTLSRLWDACARYEELPSAGKGAALKLLAELYPGRTSTLHLTEDEARVFCQELELDLKAAF